MNQTVSVESAELMFKQILEDFFVSVYDEKHLPSHGIDHHRRVWAYAKELLFVPFGEYNTLPDCDPSRLIIACYLHDVGMSLEPGPRHGRHSRELCTRFLDEYKLNLDEYEDVLHAIENHDIKDYQSESLRNDLMTVLTVADDLDAFGFTGIYRYSEICLTRGLTPVQTGPLIIDNAGRRYENLEKLYGPDNNFVRNNRKRYEILINFFTQFNKQARLYNFETDYPSGYCGVIQLFRSLIQHQYSLEEFFSDTETFNEDPIISWFIREFKSEQIS
jgi:hypothetical protein